MSELVPAPVDVARDVYLTVPLLAPASRDRLVRETDDKSLVVLLVSGAIFALTAIFGLTGRKSSELRGRDFVEVRERLIKMFFGA
jgi:hypothetical protein